MQASQGRTCNFFSTIQSVCLSLSLCPSLSFSFEILTASWQIVSSATVTTFKELLLLSSFSLYFLLNKMVFLFFFVRKSFASTYSYNSWSGIFVCIFMHKSRCPLNDIAHTNPYISCLSLSLSFSLRISFSFVFAIFINISFSVIYTLTKNFPLFSLAFFA